MSSFVAGFGEKRTSSSSGGGQSTTVVASQAAMLALSSAQVGDIAVRSDDNYKAYRLTATPASTLGNWTVIGYGNGFLPLTGGALSAGGFFTFPGISSATTPSANGITFYSSSTGAAAFKNSGGFVSTFIFQSGAGYNYTLPAVTGGVFVGDATTGFATLSGTAPGIGTNVSNCIAFTTGSVLEIKSANAITYKTGANGHQFLNSSNTVLAYVKTNGELTVGHHIKFTAGGSFNVMQPANLTVTVTSSATSATVYGGFSNVGYGDIIDFGSGNTRIVLDRDNGGTYVILDSAIAHTPGNVTVYKSLSKIMNNSGNMKFMMDYQGNIFIGKSASTLPSPIVFDLNGGIRVTSITYFTDTSDPTVTEIEDGQYQVWYNSTSSECRLWANVGGTLVSTLLT